MKLIAPLKKLLVFILLCTTHHSIAQLDTSDTEKYSKAHFYMDIGTVIAYSSATVNFEYNFLRSQSNLFALNGRIGPAYAVKNNEASGPGGIVGLTGLVGKTKHRFEVSGGAFFGNNTGFSNRELFTLPVFDIGYRYQKPQGGLILRAKVGTLGAGIGFGFAF